MRAAKILTRKRPRFLIITYCTTIETDARLSYNKKRKKTQHKMSRNWCGVKRVRNDNHKGKENYSGGSKINN